MTKKGLVQDGEFLDPISSDKPEGCWTLAMDPSAEIAVLRSLAWPGHYFFHQVQSDVSGFRDGCCFLIMGQMAGDLEISCPCIGLPNATALMFFCVPSFLIDRVVLRFAHCDDRFVSTTTFLALESIGERKTSYPSVVRKGLENRAPSSPE